MAEIVTIIDIRDELSTVRLLLNALGMAFDSLKADVDTGALSMLALIILERVKEIEAALERIGGAA